MGNTRFAIDFVHAAGLVPQHRYDSRRTVVFSDDDTQSILERVFGRLRLGCMHNAQ
jgi:hypothetical protein